MSSVSASVSFRSDCPKTPSQTLWTDQSLSPVTAPFNVESWLYEELTISDDEWIKISGESYYIYHLLACCQIHTAETHCLYKHFTVSRLGWLTHFTVFWENCDILSWWLLNMSYIDPESDPSVINDSLPLDISLFDKSSLQRAYQSLALVTDTPLASSWFFLEFNTTGGLFGG